MRSLTNVMLVLKHSLVQVTYKDIKVYTQMRSLTDAMFVVKHSLVQVTYKDIKEYI